MVALGIGVIVAGLGIGAFISVMMHQGSETTTTASTSVPAVTPVARPTRGPVAVATLVAHPTPTATPSASPSPTATPRATPSPASSPKATPSPRASETARPSPSPTPNATPSARASATPRPLATKTPAPTATPRPATPRPTPSPRPTAPPAATPLTFGGIAQNTVRRYLGDLIAGNETAAYAELGKSPGDAGALTEEAFIDRGTRITSIRTTSSDANGATVEVELRSARGSYFATYHVTNGPSGPVIDQHDYIKV